MAWARRTAATKAGVITIVLPAGVPAEALIAGEAKPAAAD
jgi:hypothetical protein